MAMSNAERQRKYRDKKRGGPPVGHWPKGHLCAEVIAVAHHTTRTMVFMASWISKYAPDLIPKIAVGGLKMTPLYRRLKREYDLGIAAALKKATAKQRNLDGWTLTERRQDGRFVFEWVRVL